MYEVGDVYAQTFTVAPGGVPTDASGTTCPITLPDGTPATPTINHTGPGVYQVVYTITQVGQHSLDFSGTVGSYAFSQSDVFNVSANASSTFIVSLADSRTAIGIPTTDTSKDEILRTVIAGATPVMEDIIGPCVATTRTETYDGGAAQICLLYAPVMSITSIVETAGGNYVHSLTEQTIFTGSGSLDSFGYSVDLSAGVITRRAAGVAIGFIPGRRNIQVVYVSGRVLKGNQILAARRLIRHLYQTEQQGFRPQMGAPDTSMGTTPSGFAVPRAVIELCAADTRPPGIG